MIHRQDEESLRRMLGLTEIPSRVSGEYAIRLNMYHRDGNTGPLGTVGLIDMVRAMGFEPPARLPPPDAKTDWRSLPQDGTVEVAARYFGEWQPGVFLGFVEAGTLAIRLDEDAFVRECRPDMVRFVRIRMAVEDETPKGWAEPEVPASQAAPTEDAPAGKPPAEQVVAEEPAAVAADEPADAPDADSPEGVFCIDHGDETLVGTLIREEGDYLWLMVDGEERRFPACDAVRV